MTPIVIPLAQASEWKHAEMGDHMELRYLIRSAMQYVQDPHIIVVGHRPAWLRTGAFRQHGTSLSVQCTHIAATDDHEVKDVNMINKINLACRHLIDIGHKKGFIRCSDDQLFLKPYQPKIYHRGTIRQYVQRKEQEAQSAHNETLKGGHSLKLHKGEEQASIPVELTKFDRKLIANMSIFDDPNAKQGVALNADSAHLPTWILSPENWLQTMEEMDEVIKAFTPTLNSLYVNANYRELWQKVGFELAVAASERPNKPTHILIHRFNGTKTIDKEQLPLFNLSASRARFLSYTDRAITGTDQTLNWWIMQRFPEKSLLED